MRSLAARTNRITERRRWAAAHTIEDLGHLTAAWLEGAIDYQPGYIGGPEQETQPITGHLAGYNRNGFLTTASQPGIPTKAGSGQRAWVEGFCTEQAAERIHRAAMHTELIALYARGAYRSNSARIAVTTIDDNDLTFAGPMTVDYINEYYARDCPQALITLHHAWQFALVDPQWGRNTLLWDLLTDALADGR